MKHSKLWTYFKAVNQAWPRPAIVFLLLSFAATLWWLYDGVYDPEDLRDLGWLEPLAAILGGIGAFLLAVILIFRRVEGAKAEADTYGLARGLATGYYFNFVRPLIGALRDSTHPVHTQMADAGGNRVAGLVIGIPETLEEFDATTHDALLAAASDRDDRFELRELKVNVAGRPRPVFVKLAISRKSKVAILLGIPTTLAVVADFAGFVAARDAEAAGAGDEFVSDARTRLVASSEAGRFGEVLEEFLDVVNKVGAMESRRLSPVALLHIIPLRRLARRLDELADH